MSKKNTKPEKCLTCYHFTALLYLNDILNQGIKHGSVPVNGSTPSKDRPQAANLTTNRNPCDQAWFGATNGLNKLKVRLKVEIPLRMLTSFARMVNDYGTPAFNVIGFDPDNERGNWYFAFDGVSPKYIKAVEVAKLGKYELVSGDELKKRVEQCRNERREKLTVKHPWPGECETTFKTGFDRSWLLDGPLFRQSGRTPPPCPWEVASVA
jgi:hypothetical protein